MLDVYRRRIVSWAMADPVRPELVSAADTADEDNGRECSEDGEYRLPQLCGGLAPHATFPYLIGESRL
jgi:hypothetical protein